LSYAPFEARTPSHGIPCNPTPTQVSILFLFFSPFLRPSGGNLGYKISQARPQSFTGAILPLSRSLPFVSIEDSHPRRYPCPSAFPSRYFLQAQTLSWSLPRSSVFLTFSNRTLRPSTPSFTPARPPLLFYSLDLLPLHQSFCLALFPITGMALSPVNMPYPRPFPKLINAHLFLFPQSC